MTAVEVVRPTTCLVCALSITGVERPEQRLIPVTLNLHEDGETWVANATSEARILGRWVVLVKWPSFMPPRFRRSVARCHRSVPSCAA